MDIEYIAIGTEGSAPDRSDTGRFVALVSLNGQLPQRLMSETCQWLHCSGCAFAIFHGESAEKWEDCLDWIIVDVEVAGIDESNDVTTSAIEFESLYEALEFAVATARLEEIPLTVLDIGSSERSLEIKAMAESIMASDI